MSCSTRALRPAIVTPAAMVLVAAVACPAPEPPAPPEAPPALLEANGTRLHARFDLPAASDAADAFTVGHRVGWYDVELDVDCAFSVQADGAYRCVPVRSPGLHVYASPTCEPGTDLVALLSLDPAERVCVPGLASHAFVSSGCEEKMFGEIVRVGTEVDASVASHGFVKSVFGDCDPWEGPIGGEPVTFCAVEVVGPEAFVAARAEVRDVDGVRLEVLLGDDGAVEVNRLLHPAFDVSMFPQSGVLVPQVPQLLGAFEGCICGAAPETCADAFAISDGACAPPTTFRVAADGCEAGCFAVTEALPDVTYEEERLGEGRLRALWLARDEPLVHAGAFFDEELGARCSAGAAPDGTTRCFPRDGDRGLWFDVFADDACTSFLGHANLELCAPGDAPVHVPDFPQGVVRRLAPLGPPPAGPHFRGLGPPFGESFGCAPLVAAPALLYELDAVVDAAALAELVTVVP